MKCRTSGGFSSLSFCFLCLRSWHLAFLHANFFRIPLSESNLLLSNLTRILTKNFPLKFQLFSPFRKFKFVNFRLFFVGNSREFLVCSSSASLYLSRVRVKWLFLKVIESTLGLVWSNPSRLPYYFSRSSFSSIVLSLNSIPFLFLCFSVLSNRFIIFHYSCSSTTFASLYAKSQSCLTLR